ncbi:MAG TPA: hypothetical protein PKK23_08650 [Nitrospirales bacterium]|nr:hypothetical protein [Nitrospirales bacterium]
MKARARRIEFHLSMVFPPNEDYSVPLLRLMLATDDSRHLRKLLLNADEHFDKGNDLECSILNGELLHLFRLLCGHLYEAGVAFRSLEKIRPGYFKNILPNRQEIITHLNFLNTAYSVGEEGAFHYSFLKPVRDRVGFHYKETIFLERLNTHVQTDDLEGNLIITQFSGLSRYSVTDHLVMSAIHDLLGGGLDNFQENFEQAMGQAINLAASLENVLNDVLLSIFKTHPEFISKITEGEVCISPSFLKAKEKAERLRDNTSIK